MGRWWGEKSEGEVYIAGGGRGWEFLLFGSLDSNSFIASAILFPVAFGAEI